MSSNPADRLTTVELVRHGYAASRDQWTGREAERPLTSDGRAQAKLLAELLPESGEFAGIWSSPTVRCMDTMAPLAAATGLKVSEAGELDEAHVVPVLDGGDAWVSAAWLGGKALGLIDELVTAHQGRRLVLCSHGDVIPAVLASLAGRDGLELPDVRCRKGGRFSLTFYGRRCVAAVPQVPPSVE